MNHREFAQRAYKLALKNKISQNEWRIVVYFYAAVHAANHIIFSGGAARPNYRHDERGVDIDNHPTLKKLSRDYRQLKKLSETARYTPTSHPMLDSQVAHAEKLSTGFLALCGILPPNTPPPPAPVPPTTPAAGVTTGS